MTIEMKPGRIIHALIVAAVVCGCAELDHPAPGADDRIHHPMILQVLENSVDWLGAPPTARHYCVLIADYYDPPTGVRPTSAALIDRLNAAGLSVVFHPFETCGREGYYLQTPAGERAGLLWAQPADRMRDGVLEGGWLSNGDNTEWACRFGESGPGHLELEECQLTLES